MTRRPIDIAQRPVIAANPGPAPMLQWIPLDRLVIDDDYQRPLGKANWTAIQKIAASFAWSRFQPLLVAPVAGGQFAIIGGQHRAHAAMLCGIAEVPAVAVQVDLAEQSRAFASVNSQSIRVTLFHIYKAALAAREDWAVRADAAVRDAGCRLMVYYASQAFKKPGEIYCIGVIRKAIEAGHDAAVTAALAAVAAHPRLGQSVASYTDYLLQPWIGAVAAQPVRDAETLAAALGQKNPFKLIEAARLSNLSGTAMDRSRKALSEMIFTAAKERAA